MNCPKCGGPMWDNRETKRAPAGPDWKCQDRTCMWRYNEKTQTWEPSQYQTAAWEPKPGQTNKYPLVPKKEVVKAGTPDWDAIAEGKIRHGLVCSMIEAGWDQEKITASVPFWVKYIQGQHPEIPF